MKIIFVKLSQMPIKAFDHLTNKKHSVHHRMFTGVCFMFTGVCISMFVGEVHGLKMIADGFGYLLHGAGCTPFIDHLTTLANED